ncbi:hypothetical protein NL676_008822 [Syzygium grande]|nr:hypothetical protein NL676_008822 [Syzygium grande]
MPLKEDMPWDMRGVGGPALGLRRPPWGAEPACTIHLRCGGSGGVPQRWKLHQHQVTLLQQLQPLPAYATFVSPALDRAAPSLRPPS